MSAVSLLAITALHGCTPESDSTNTTRIEAPPATTAPAQADALVGRLLLPGEGGRRGVEVHAWVAAQDGEEHQLWILPDADGRFERDISGVLTGISVSAGSEVHRIETPDLPRADDSGTVDLGAIDLRESVVARRVRLRDREGASGGVVRVGLWIGPPHTGPRGEMPSLGSRQFPPVEIGNEIEWLLPPDAGDVYFLVERPDGPGRGMDWRSGEQHLFGPFATSAFPLELVLD